jgi:predicted lipid-binding transport protein (Tim44 family)
MSSSPSKDRFMKPWWLSALALIVAIGLPLQDANAKRLGSGGMQRSMPTRSAPDSTPAKPAQPPNQATPAQPGNAAQQGIPAGAGMGAQAAQAGKRSWLGPIAGLAAGIGLAALFSHFGMGEAVSNIMMMLLLAVAAVFVIGWLMRRFGAGKNQAGGPSRNPFEPAYAGAGASPDRTMPQAAAPLQRETLSPVAGGAPGSAAASFASGGSVASLPSGNLTLPADFDRAGFERLAKLIFIRMQAANDRCDLADLRNFTTPEMFASIRLDLQNRGDSTQQTDVVQVDAEVVDMVREPGLDIVSVRYHGMIREEPSHPAMPFDELWHLVRPSDGSREWAIAGIQPGQ